MVSATVKFAMATGSLNDKREEKDMGVPGDLQVKTGIALMSQA